MLTKDRLSRLCRARDLLRDLDHAELSIADVAQAIALSRFHFIRQFKAVFGETPAQFRTRERLEAAKRLLVEGNETVTDICMTVGFTSLGSFSALFAERVGQAPTAYRKELDGDFASLQPHCLMLLREAWSADSQFSRSQKA
ncbi:MAG: helix-turn-helix transcriptional regulator [Pseudomonadota bacterium]